MIKSLRNLLTSIFEIHNILFIVFYIALSFEHSTQSIVTIQASAIVLCIFLTFLNLFPEKIRIIPTLTSVTFLSIYFGLQRLFFRSFNQFGLIKTALSVDKNMLRFADSAVELLNWVDILVFLAPIIALLLLIKYRRKNLLMSFSLNFVFRTLIFSLSSFYLYQSFHTTLDVIASEPLKLQDNKVIYANVPNTNQFVDHFGLNGLLLREMDYTVKPIILEKNVTLEEQISEMLILSSLLEKSDYSGIFKNHDLLLIEAESLNNFAIDPILTPTLYHLKHSGLVILGYNSPLLPGSTSDTEFMVNTSLLPSNNGNITFNTYVDNVFPLTLANRFTDKGYYSMASHNNYGVYYNRTNMLPKLGYEFFDAIGLNAYDNVEDSYVIDHIKWIQYERERFFSFWITYNGHQPYTTDTLTDNMKGYFELVKQRYPNLPEAEQVFLAKNMDLDRGLKQLLIDYKNSNRLNDLVIIIYGDHQPKGLFGDKTNYASYCSLSDNIFEYCFDTPFIIWNNDEVMGYIEKTSSPLDIAPTIFDLFDLDYDYHLALGRSVFDPSNEGFSFNEFGVIKTDNFIYDTLRDTLVLRNWTKSEETYRLEAEALYQRFLLGYKIVETDYFASPEYRERFVRN